MPQRNRGSLRPFLPLCLVLLWILAPAGCGDDGNSSSRPGQGPQEQPGVQVRFDLTGEGSFYDLPFPTDLLRRDGDRPSLDLSLYPRQSPSVFRKLMNDYVSLAEQSDGFSLSTVSYFLFEAPIEEANLPVTPVLAQSRDSTVFLADVDPRSPEYGRRFPIALRFYRSADKFHPENLLAIAPYPGFPLRPRTRYGAVVLRSLGDASGAPLGSPLPLQQLLYGVNPGGPQGSRAVEVFAPLAAYLRDEGIPAASVAAANAFTTGDPVADTERIYSHVCTLPVPTPCRPLVRTREYETYSVLESAFTAPQFQQGDPPYLFGGGAIVFDQDGKPVEQRREEVPFALSIPKGRMPAAGWPLVIYIHGTGGVSTQFVDRGRRTDPDTPPPPGTGPALTFAQRGIAAAGAALPVHPERGGLLQGMDFYNVFQPAALRDNLRQAMAEQVLFLRMLRQLAVDPALCPGTDASLAPDGQIRFDPDHLFAMGQSLGSLVLDLWAALEDNLVAVIPSGTGAHFGVMALEMREFPFLSLLEVLLGASSPDEIDLFHPFLNLVLLAWGPADPVNFARHYFLEPLEGRQPKHVQFSQGFFDAFFTPPAQNAFIAAAGLQLAGEPFPADEFDAIARARDYDSPWCGIEQPCSASTVEITALRGLAVAPYPVSGNIDAGGGRPVTAVVVEQLDDGILDGHNVNFQFDSLKYQVGCFLRTLVDTGTPVLLEPDSIDAACR